MTVPRDPNAYPVTPLQMGMLYNGLAMPGSGVEIEQIVVTTPEPLDRDAFAKSWQKLVARHEILRTRFKWSTPGEPLQVVEPDAAVPVEFFDCRNLEAEAQEREIRSYIAGDRLRDFDMAAAPLMRVAAFDLADSHFSFVWTFHHALLDGRSFPVLLRELFEFYEADRAGRTLALGPAPSFRDYVRWLTTRDTKDDEAFWREELAGFSEPVPLPYLRPALPDRGRQGRATAETRLPAATSEALRQYARANGLSLNTLLHGAWALLLHHYSGKSDVLFATTWSCRYAPVNGADSMVGLLINTVPMRVAVSEQATAAEFLAGIRRKHLQTRSRVYMPLPRIAQFSGCDPHVPLFDSLVVYESYLLNSALQAQGGLWKDRQTEYLGQTSFPLTLAAYDDREILLRLEYYPERFDASQIDACLGHLRTLLPALVEQPERRAVDVPYMTQGELDTILSSWNDTARPYPRERCIHELFEEQARLHPDARALTLDGTSVSYAELDRRANLAARRLVSLGVGPEVRVAICLDRSVEMIVAILGILKAGGAYVPLDPAYPKDRLAFMLQDTDAPVLIVDERYRDRLPSSKAAVLSSDEMEHGDNVAPAVEPAVRATATNLAYVMYTSGSTGVPKGIEVTHRNVVRLVRNNHFADLDASQVFLLYAPISFDASTLELWGPLLNGGRLVVAPPRQLTAQELGAVIQRHGVTTLWLTAGLFHGIVASHLECLKPVRQLLAGGDVLAPSAVRKVLEALDGTAVINGYGPTENTTFTCCYRADRLSEFGASVPIGKPIANTRVYILDQRRQPVPAGVPGELYTSGDGVARGYLNRPDLTEAAFLPNWIPGDPHPTVYRTGDLARHLPDGNIEFLGRNDGQVKLRGYRIELGEVEAGLLSLGGVSQAVAMVREDRPGDKRLVGYYVPRGVATTPEALRDMLASKLPHYMVPQHLVEMPSFPINPNGKVDRKRLPPPTVGAGEAAAFVPPQTATEKTVASIWQRVLNVEKVGRHDNFFDLGGDSLLSVSLFAEIHRATGRNLPLSSLYKAPTVEELARVVESEPGHSGQPLDEGTAAQAEAIDRAHATDSTAPDRPWRCLVEIKPTGSRRPFFCIHAVGGNVLNYRRLAPVLHPEQPLYGIQARGLDGVSRPLGSIEAMAALYVEEIKTVQPAGPYLVGGGSMGGTIALEVAQQMKRGGDEVRLLVMFDTLGPNYHGTTSSSEAARPLTRARRLIVRNASLAKLTGAIWHSVRERARDLSRLLQCRACQARRVPISHDLRYWFIERANRAALLKYEPKPYDGRIHLIRGSLHESGVYSDPERGWAGLASGGVSVIAVEGAHETLVEVPELGQRLSDLLDDVNG